MRVSSPIVPFFNGTLKSTRMKTRWPSRSRSLMDSFIGVAKKGYGPFLNISKGVRQKGAVPLFCYRPASQTFGDQLPQQIDAAVRVAPFVVVPGQDLQKIAFHHSRVRHVDDGGVRVPLE